MKIIYSFTSKKSDSASDNNQFYQWSQRLRKTAFPLIYLLATGLLYPGSVLIHMVFCHPFMTTNSQKIHLTFGKTSNLLPSLGHCFGLCNEFRQGFSFSLPDKVWWPSVCFMGVSNEARVCVLKAIKRLLTQVTSISDPDDVFRFDFLSCEAEKDVLQAKMKPTGFRINFM